MTPLKKGSQRIRNPLFPYPLRAEKWFFQGSPVRETKMSYTLWVNNENLQLLLEAAPVAIVTVNHTGHILFVNAKLEDMFGYTRQELIGQTIELLLPPRFHHLHVNYREQYMEQPHMRSMGMNLDLVGYRKNGTEFPIEVGLSFIQTENGTLIQALMTDITVRKQAQEKLEQHVAERTREIERRRQVSDGLSDILRMLNSNYSLEELLDYIVAQASQLLEAKASAIYRLDDDRLVIQTSQGLPQEYVATANVPLGEGAIGEAVLSGQPVVISDLPREGTTASKARRKLLLEHGCHTLLAVPLNIKSETYGGIVLYYTKQRDFSKEQIDLAVTFGDQVALAIENARLRTQVEQAAVAAERSRLARDLHDSVTQTLFSASVIAEVLPRLWKRDIAESERRIEELRQLTRGALAEMRTLLLELRPSTLTEVPLGDLLRQLGEAINGRARVPIILEIEGQATFRPDVQVAFYRIAQEALNNVVKHADAYQVKVKLHCQPEQVTLSVCDDGCGFVLDGISPDRLGLNIMQERADSIGAKLDIISWPNHGTEVSIVWQNN
jgi:PAS domain S-box-containing protein